MEEWREDRVGSALRGENPRVFARMPAAFATMGEAQFLPGYCVLLTDDPAVTRLSDLAPAARRDYLDSVAALAEAVEGACAAADPAFRRVNVEILGNASPFLHTHVWPRYAWEPDHVVRRPVWVYPIERWHEPATALGPQHDALRQSIADRL
ncbi:diadenosine tetraphosphate hydrolase [Streptomyces sp. NP160]|uniref:HIT family protein n=1 Tax=Streptomyces sp. NP160 TaxID=2586637 RepID=UPI00111B6EF6|nr:diadenosine tetraphosphate hydrolase [Streptomyces sp. NP160]TNM64124.1 diadenosine tetraphosphate hydrolase [Streptomyces sp. NP160]